jgi:hypothetical protein
MVADVAGVREISDGLQPRLLASSPPEAGDDLCNDHQTPPGRPERQPALEYPREQKQGQRRGKADGADEHGCQSGLDGDSARTFGAK